MRDVSIASGTKLGRYEIRSKIGEGGMGEVYVARDTQLGRDVAVKVLPSRYSGDEERLRRFEQEACAASALNHPNILSIYDVGTHDGSPYVVSELLEEQTLRQRTSVVMLPQRKVIDYALQIVHGLAAAHGKGIVHRDLKPENIFISKDGRVKILDFGLAKLTGAADSDLSQTSIPTRRVDTDPGKVIGTVGYMSPEQVKGRIVDHRSDVFSFGAILYEMLSGHRAFHGESPAETMSAILKEDPPDLSETNHNISPALERLLNHCLEKNPEERFHSARDLAFALEAISGAVGLSSQKITQTPAPSSRERIKKYAPWIVASIFACAFLVLLILYFRRPPADVPAAITRFSIPPPEQAVFLDAPVISPDGRRVIVETRGASGQASLWMRPLDSLEAQPLPGTEGGARPFWSPDGRSIGLFVASKLKRIDVAGGPAQTLCDAPVALGGTWNRDGIIIFGRGTGEGLYRIPATGGAPAPVTVLDKSRNEIAQGWPYFLPDGRHFLYGARSTEQDKSGIFVGSLDSKETILLPNIASSVAYAPPGYLLFVREGTLMAQPFDAERLQLSGEAVPVVEHVGFDAVFGRAAFSISQTGVLVYRSTTSFQNTQLVWFDRTGKRLGTVGDPAEYSDIRLSPDGTHVALQRLDTGKKTTDIWSIELIRGIPSRFTFGSAGADSPVWSPDGSRIAFVSRKQDLYQKFASGMGEDELLLRSDKQILPCDWSSDGRYILFQTPDEKGSHLWVLPLFVERKPVRFLPTDFAEANGRFSPDGRWIAYASNESGEFEVYVRSFPASGAEWQISNGGGGHPRWRRDGKELFYLSKDRKLMAVEINGSAGTFEVGVTKPLFELGIGSTPGPSPYDVMADGQRFLVNMPVEGKAPTPLTVVMNWTTELKN